MKITPLVQPAYALPPGYAALPHVLIVVDGLAGPMGGGERIVLRLASLLPDYGYRVSILTFQAPTNPEVLANPPCPIYLLPLTNVFGFSALGAAFYLGQFIRAQKIKIVQTFFESSDLWAGLVVRTLSSARLIWSRRDMGILRKRKHRLAYRLLASMPDRVFAVSELVRKHGIEVDGIDPLRVQTVYNGLNIADWNRGTLILDRAEAIVITTVGNIRHVKGHDIFVRAAAQIAVRYPSAVFSVAGATLDTAYFEHLQALIRELGLTERFHFAGGLKDLRSHFAGADIFVLPSRSEGFSNAIVEAMAMSLPVVATDVGGNAEAVSEGVSGYIVPTEDPDALATAILKLLDDPARAREMGEAGKQIVAERFTIDAMMTTVARAYGEVLARRASALGHSSRLAPPASPEGSASST